MSGKHLAVYSCFAVNSPFLNYYAIYFAFLIHCSYGVLENVDKAQTKVRAKNENVAGTIIRLIKFITIAE